MHDSGKNHTSSAWPRLPREDFPVRVCPVLIVLWRFPCECLSCVDCYVTISLWGFVLCWLSRDDFPVRVCLVLTVTWRFPCEGLSCVDCHVTISLWGFVLCWLSRDDFPVRICLPREDFPVRVCPVLIVLWRFSCEGLSRVDCHVKIFLWGSVPCWLSCEDFPVSVCPMLIAT